MSSENTNQEEESAASPTEEDLDSDVGTIFSDEEGGCKELDDDDEEECGEAGQVSEDDSGSSSSESDDGSEKCPICLQRFGEQETGSPEMCEHQFCLKCITAWSKKMATCPIDRKFFSTIIVKSQWDGEVIRIDDVQFPNTQNNEEEYDSNPTYCESCGRCDREEIMLLCDGCDLGYHLECLDPPLEYVPIEDWYCPSCIAQGINADDEEPEVVFEASTSRPQTAPTRTRIPRTLQNERILQSIDVPSSPIRDVIEAVMQGINAANTGPSRPRKPRTTTPRKTRKSKTTRKRKSTTGGTNTRRKRRTKRKTRRRRRVAVDKRPNTSRGRIAHHLGIVPPLPGQVYVGLPPACRSAGGISHSSSTSASTSGITSLRYSAGITPLRMFGAPANDLSDLVECDSDEEGPTSFATARVPQLQRSLGASLKGPPRVISTSSSLVSPQETQTSCDILGSILKKQFILHNDKNIKISRDGTLVPSMISNTLPTHMSPTKSNSPSKPGATTPTSPSPSSSPSGRGSGQGSSRSPSRIIVCGLNNEQNQNTHTSSGNLGNGNGTSSGDSNMERQGSNEGNARDGEGLGSSNTLGNSGGSGSKCGEDELWGNDSLREPDDDDFDIYSDIEENPQEPEKTESMNGGRTAASESNSIEGGVAGESKDGPFVSPRKASQDSLNNTQAEDHDSDLDEMVIDEDSGGVKQSPQKELETSGSDKASRRSSTNEKDENMQQELEQVDDAGSNTPLRDEAMEMDIPNLPESPESIPLPDSPPPGISDEDDQNEQRTSNVVSKLPKEYDPSDPLASSEDDENSKRNLERTASKQRSPSPKPQRIRKTGQIRNAAAAAAAAAAVARAAASPRKEVGKKPEAASTVPDLSSIPMPPEEPRRHVIHFSIPKRHNLIPISSLMKRQKGMAKKESKGVDFQSEISKAFGSEGQEEGSAEDARTDDEQNLPKISLVAEIFGSDEDEDVEMQTEVDATAVVISATGPQSEKPTEEEADKQDELETEAERIADAAVDLAIENLSSRRWKTVSNEVIEPEPIAPVEKASTETQEKGADGAGINEKAGQGVCHEPENELEIIEIVTLNCPPRPPPRRFLGPGDIETISDTDNSDIEVIDEVSTPKAKRKDKDRSSSRSKSRSPDRDRRRERKRRHSASSVASFGDNAEPEDTSVGARKRRKERKRKERLKQSRVSRDNSGHGDIRRQSGTGLHSNISSSDNEAENDVNWKRSSKRSSDRSYRGERRKSSRSITGRNRPSADRSISPGFRSRRGRGTASPRREPGSPSYNKRASHSRYSDRLSRSTSRSRARWSRRRSRSGSSVHSFGSFNRSPSRRHQNVHRATISPHLLGHSRSPSQSPEAIRPRSSHLSRGSRSISGGGAGGSRDDRSGRHRRKRRHTLSRSKSPTGSLARAQRKSKHLSKSSVADSLKKQKKAKLLKKTGKTATSAAAAAVLKSKRKGKQQRLKDKIEKRKLSKSKSGGAIDEDKLFGGKSRKDKGEKRKRKREKSLSPVKAIVADGDSIVVSLSFQKETPSSHSSSALEKGSSGKGAKKLKESTKHSRSSSKLKENAAKVKSPSVNKQLLDLGAEDLSSNSETSSSVSKREKEMGASKVSSSGDGSVVDTYNAVGSSAMHVEDTGEIQGDSLVTSTRDSLEPSATTEDDYPSATSPTHGKTSSQDSTVNKVVPQNVSSSAHSPRVQGNSSLPSSLQQSGVGAQPTQGGSSAAGLAAKAASSAIAVGIDALQTQAIPGAATMSTSSQQPNQQIRYPAANSGMFTPMLATVATALFAARHQPPGPVPGTGAPSSATKASKSKSRSHGNFQGGAGDTSPMSPNSSDGDDLFEPPTDQGSKSGKGGGGHSTKSGSSSGGNISTLFDDLFGSEPKQNARQEVVKPSKPRPQNRQQQRKGGNQERREFFSGGRKETGPQQGHGDINEDVPASAVEMSIQEKLINKINRQERVVEEVKVCLKPYYIKKHVNKEEYKEILRRAVPKVCHSKTGEINPFKIRELVDAYVRKFRHSRKKSA